MEEQKFMKRENNRCRYDKRFILKVVKEIEAGLPRKEAKRIYEVGEPTLYNWMKEYGSENYHQNIKRRHYSKLKKRTIISAIEQGRMSISEAKVAYNIKCEKIIRNWLTQFKEEKVQICYENQQDMDKSPSLKTSEKKALNDAILEAELKIKALNTLIDVAEVELKINIRKKSGAKQF